MAVQANGISDIVFAILQKMERSGENTQDDLEIAALVGSAVVSTVNAIVDCNRVLDRIAVALEALAENDNRRATRDGL